VSSLDFRSSGVLGPSRGPSPLTIGLCDSIPLAVAFHEIIHAYFKGSNESRYYKYFKCFETSKTFYYVSIKRKKWFDKK